MEDWILESAERPLDHPSVEAIRKWRKQVRGPPGRPPDTHGVGRFTKCFPMKPLVRAYWAVMMAGASRTSSRRTSQGLHGLYPTPQFSIAKELSDGKTGPLSRGTSSRNV